MLFHIIISKGNDLISNRVEKSFTVQFIAVFLPIHVAYMCGVTFDFKYVFYISRQPGEISKIRSSTPIRYLIFGMEILKTAPKWPPHILKKKNLGIFMSSLQSAQPFTSSACQMLRYKLCMCFFKYQCLHPFRTIKNVPIFLTGGRSGRSSSLNCNYKENVAV